MYIASIAAVARVDVDHDGTDEFIAKAQCMTADGEYYQVFALRPDGKGGYATFATVIGQNRSSGGDISAVGDLAVTSAGEVIVNVASKENSLAPWAATGGMAAAHLCVERPGVHPDRRAHDVRR